MILLLVTVVVSSLDAPKVVLCGRRLAAIMSKICNSEQVIEKDVSNSIEGLEYAWRWLVPHLANKLGHPLSQDRIKRGIVSECCKKARSRDEMLLIIRMTPKDLIRPRD